MPQLRKQPSKSVLLPKIIFMAILWLFGLFWFVEQIPVEPVKAENILDAVVVLTGGKQRIEAGMKLLLDKKAKRMLISGVPFKTTLKDLLQHTEFSQEQLQSVQHAITLGNLATDTSSNAMETSIWTELQHIDSFYLVTGNYHMKRSLAEFRVAMPQRTIVPYPIIVDTVMLERLLQFPRSLWLLTVEYNKYIAFNLKTLMHKWVTFFR